MTPDAINACAALVDRGDPDRFLAAMAAPVVQRGPLFVLYAFNLELARAPWVTREAIIAQMRLQFWRDVVALEEPKAHEVADPLQVLIRDGLPVGPLNAMIDAREAEIGTSAPFEDEAALWRYLEGTAGALMEASVQALGGPQSDAARSLGTAQGLANYLLAIPALEAAGRHPLPDGRPESLVSLARQARARLNAARPALRQLPRAALMAAWRADALLAQVEKAPQTVAQGLLGQSEFARRGSLLMRKLSGF